MHALHCVCMHDCAHCNYTCIMCVYAIHFVYIYSCIAVSLVSSTDECLPGPFQLHDFTDHDVCRPISVHCVLVCALQLQSCLNIKLPVSKYVLSGYC